MNSFRIDVTVDDSALKSSAKMLQALGTKSQKCVTRAAGKGATVTRRVVKGLVPVRTGALKRGIVRNGERSRFKGKKVYDLMFDPKKNNDFQKHVVSVGALGGNYQGSKHAYYPASMEYGFLAKAKGAGFYFRPGRHVPTQRIEGHHFMSEGGDRAEPAAYRKMIDTLNEEVDRTWRKEWGV